MTTRGLIYQDEQTAKDYEASYQNQYRRADKLEKQLITKMLAQFPDAKTLLEVGCGTGHFTKWLQTQGYHCQGLDLSSGMLGEAKKVWSPSNLIKGDASHLPIQDKSVDLTFFVTSLEFIPDAPLALSEAARIAKKGIILGLLNKNSPSTFKIRIHPKKYALFCSATFYSLREMRKVLAQNISAEHEIAFWSTTVFPRILGNLESAFLPFGDFLGIAVKLQ